MPGGAPNGIARAPRLLDLVRVGSRSACRWRRAVSASANAFAQQRPSVRPSACRCGRPRAELAEVRDLGLAHVLDDLRQLAARRRAALGVSSTPSAFFAAASKVAHARRSSATSRFRSAAETGSASDGGRLRSGTPNSVPPPPFRRSMTSRPRDGGRWPERDLRAAWRPRRSAARRRAAPRAPRRASWPPRDQPGQSSALANDRFGATSRTTRIASPRSARVRPRGARVDGGGR